MQNTDQPIAALLTDLKALGRLDPTLVIWISQFGRAPLAEGVKGRDHHPYVFQFVVSRRWESRRTGARFERRFRTGPPESPFDTHDFNATILRLMGLDHTRLTYPYRSRDMRLTAVDGEHEFTAWLIRG